MSYRHSSRRVLVIAPHPFYEDRGTPIAVRHVVSALSELGWHVDILTYCVGEDISLPRVRIFRFGKWLPFKTIPVGLSPKKLLLDVLMPMAMVHRLLAEKYDCIHAVEEAVYPALLIRSLSKVPVIYDMQSSIAEQIAFHPVTRKLRLARFMNWMEKKAYIKADVIACSAGIAQKYRNVQRTTLACEWTFPARNHEKRYSAASGVRQKLSIPESQRIVIYTGNFARYQGIPLLLEAFAQLQRRCPETTLLLIGASPARLRDCATTHAALIDSGHLVVLPRLPRSELNAYLEIADLAVSPRIDGCNLPLKIFDYLASDLPVVATDIPAHHPLADKGLLLVPPTAAGLCDGIADLLEDAAARDSLLTQLREFVTATLDWPTFRAQVSNMYAPILAKRASPEPIGDQCREPGGDARNIVSVVIPARNEGANIEKVIAAINSQGGVNAAVEIIVVNDGSDDDTVTIAEQSGARVLDMEQNGVAGNPARARNSGAQASRGDPIVFLDADCVPAPGWLSSLLAAREKQATIVGGALDLPAQLGPVARCDYYCGCYFIHSGRTASFVPHHPPNNIAVQRTAFLESTGFAEEPPLNYTNEERHWQGELQRAGHRIYFEPAAIVHHYNRPGFGNLMRRSYRWGYTALEAKSESGSTRAGWLFSRPWLVILLAPILPFALTLHIIGSWARTGTFEPVLMAPIIFASRIVYVAGMVTGGIRWMRAGKSGRTQVRPAPKWQ